MIILVILRLIDLYILAIIIRAVLSWVNVDPYNPVVSFLHRITDPFLSRIQRMVPLIGNIDISPIIAIMILSLMKRLIISIF